MFQQTARTREAPAVDDEPTATLNLDLDDATILFKTPITRPTNVAHEAHQDDDSTQLYSTSGRTDSAMPTIPYDSSPACNTPTLPYAATPGTPNRPTLPYDPETPLSTVPYDALDTPVAQSHHSSVATAHDDGDDQEDATTPPYVPNVKPDPNDSDKSPYTATIPYEHVSSPITRPDATSDRQSLTRTATDDMLATIALADHSNRPSTADQATLSYDAPGSSIPSGDATLQYEDVAATNTGNDEVVDATLQYEDVAATNTGNDAAVDATLQYEDVAATNTGNDAAVDATLQYGDVAGNDAAVDATLQYGDVAGNDAAVDATLQYGDVAGNDAAVDATLQYEDVAAANAGNDAAVDATLQYGDDDDTADMPVSDATLQYGDVAGNDAAVDATLQYGDDDDTADMPVSDATLQYEDVAATNTGNDAAVDATLQYEDVAATNTGNDAAVDATLQYGDEEETSEILVDSTMQYDDDNGHNIGNAAATTHVAPVDEPAHPSMPTTPPAPIGIDNLDNTPEIEDPHIGNAGVPPRLLSSERRFELQATQEYVFDRAPSGPTTVQYDAASDSQPVPGNAGVPGLRASTSTASTVVVEAADVCCAHSCSWLKPPGWLVLK
jgi:hypothetical protein